MTAVTLLHPRSTARILVVDDEPKLRESVAEGLRLETWDVATAANGAEALQLLDTHPFDLLVLDYMLPDTNAFELVRHVRSRGVRTPALIVSAHVNAETRRGAMESGANEFVAKPFAFAELVDRCHALLRGTAA